MTEFIAIGSIIIDDIVDPMGKSSMGVLGGGASHAVAGMRVWSEQTAMVSVIGEGFPETAWDQLTDLANVNGVIKRPALQPRAWQLFEPDGTRNEVFRTDFTIFRDIPIRPDEFPPAFASAKGVFLQTDTADRAKAWVTHLRRLNPEMILLWEPWEIFYTPENLANFQRVAPLFDIVSPNSDEASWMFGETDPQKQANLLFECGVRCLALRLGAAGSIVGTASKTHHIPAIKVPVIDETGAGNSYNGGFLVGYIQSNGNPLTAGQYGSVSATFALAQLGLAQLGPDTQRVAQERLAGF